MDKGYDERCWELAGDPLHRGAEAQAEAEAMGEVMQSIAASKDGERELF